MHDTAIVILIHCEDKLISMTFNSWITFAHRFSIKDCCVLLPGDEEEAAGPKYTKVNHTTKVSKWSKHLLYNQKHKSRSYIL